MKHRVKFRLPHNYDIDGEDVPSFSEIIDFASRRQCPKCEGAGHGCRYCKGKGVLSWYTDESSERGTWIHNSCFALLRGTLDIEKAYREYPDRMKSVNAFYRFIVNQGLESQPCIIEYPLYSSEINTAGTFDIFFYKQMILIELKSGKFKPADKFQIAVYKHLIEWNMKQGWLKGKVKPGKVRPILVYLDEKGYSAKEYPDIMVEYLTLFRSLQVTKIWNQKLIGG